MGTSDDSFRAEGPGLFPQLKSKLAVNSWMRPRIMMLKATTMRSSLSSAVPCSTACGTWLGQINMRPFSAGCA